MEALTAHDLKVATSAQFGPFIARVLCAYGLKTAGILMRCIPATEVSARLVWNFTPSAPPGLYSPDHGNWREGDRVAVQPVSHVKADLEVRGSLPRGKVLTKGS